MFVKQTVAICISSLLFASLLFVLSLENAKAENEISYTERGTISIIDNSEFTSANGVVSGNGSKENPYIIEGWNISAKNKNGIQIRNTDKYFVIRECYLRDGRYVYAGIYFDNVRNGKIENCKIEKNSYGIWLVLSNSNVIINNQIKNSDYGILLSSSMNNNMTNNVIENSDIGIELYSSPYNIVMNNNVNDNLIGINVAEDKKSYSSKNNTIISNNISNNFYGIYLSSSNNKIYLNNFINNTNQAYDTGSNFWSSSDKGNYWSKYKGKDDNGDGIGDSPYSISGGNNKDNYPLMNPNPNAGVQKQPNKEEENKQLFPYFYEILILIIEIIIVAIILISLYLYLNRKPKKIYQFQPRIEKHIFASYQPDGTPYSHPSYYDDYYKKRFIQTTCPKCNLTFQINNLQKEIVCPNCGIKGEVK